MENSAVRPAGQAMKSLSDTFIFKEYDKSIGLQNTILKLTTEGVILSEDDVKDCIIEIDRRYYFTSKNQVISDFRAGKFKLLFNNKGYRLPNTIPAYLINTGKGISCIVNVSNHMQQTKDGKYTIDTKMLFCLMQAGSIMAKCFESFGSITNRSQIIKSGSAIYSKLFTKILNRMYSINVNAERLDVITYLSSLFFITNVMGRTNMLEMNKKYAVDNCKDTSKLIIEDTISKFDLVNDFKDFDTFIKALAKNVYGIDSLTTRAFMDNYISSYGPTMLLSLEFLPLFFYNMFAVVVGAFVNNQHVLETTVGKDLDVLFNSFFS